MKTKFVVIIFSVLLGFCLGNIFQIWLLNKTPTPIQAGLPRKSIHMWEDPHGKVVAEFDSWTGKWTTLEDSYNQPIHENQTDSTNPIRNRNPR